MGSIWSEPETPASVATSISETGPESQVSMATSVTETDEERKLREEEMEQLKQRITALKNSNAFEDTVKY